MTHDDASGEPTAGPRTRLEVLRSWLSRLSNGVAAFGSSMNGIYVFWAPPIPPPPRRRDPGSGSEPGPERDRRGP